MEKLTAALAQLRAADARAWIETSAHLDNVEALRALAVFAGVAVHSEWTTGVRGEMAIREFFTAKLDGVTLRVQAERKPTARDWTQKMEAEGGIQ